MCVGLVFYLLKSVLKPLFLTEIVQVAPFAPLLAPLVRIILILGGLLREPTVPFPFILVPFDYNSLLVPRRFIIIQNVRE